MVVSETSLLELIKKADQFTIPIFQRNYSWHIEQCRQLWDDIIKAGDSDKIRSHFLGSIMYVKHERSNVTWTPLTLIDGQQRLTSVTLLLAALKKALNDNDKPLEDFTRRKITARYLINTEEEDDDKRYKLVLSKADLDSLLSIINENIPQGQSDAVINNFEFFESMINSCGNLELVCRGLTKLRVVDIAIFPEYDNPQLIFESMNSTGLALSQADLIRNFLLMNHGKERQQELYNSYWRPMELNFGPNAPHTNFDAFIRHFLSFKTGKLPNENRVYQAFKDYFDNCRQKEISISEVMDEIRKHASYFCKMALSQEEDKELLQAFKDLAELKANVAYPMLLEWYDDYKNDKWSKDNFLEALRYTESYIWRRAVCSLPANALNKIFLLFNKSINKDSYLDSVKAAYIMLGTYKRFPDDDEFKQSLKTRNLYKTSRSMYWLKRLEQFDNKEKVDLEKTPDISVEHIMPQNVKLSREWKMDLGPEWQRIHEQWLHTLGNLTLTAYNQNFSDKSFIQKKNMEHGFRDSKFWLNQGLKNIEKWDEDAIKNRAETLAKRALQVWARPEMDERALSLFLPKKKKEALYTIDDHPYLALPEIKPLYEALRKAVLELDPAVSEEFRKNYVAYKLDTNFADAEPLKTFIRLVLNMDYEDIHDPKGIARDVTNIGRRGNGNVEIIFSKLEELPYIMDLIRQALERQIE